MSYGTNTTPSNATGLSLAEETTFKVLPAVPVWDPMEPNSYGDFGAEISNTAREPIGQDRQNKKGVITDLDASGSFEIDFTQKTPYKVMTGFMCANWREKANQSNVSATAAAVVTTALATLDRVNALMFTEGFVNSGNSGFKLRTGGSATAHNFAGASVEAAGTDKIVYDVGQQFAAGDLEIDVTGSVVTLSTTLFDLTTLGLIAGESIWLGGDLSTTTAFNEATNNGWYRIGSLTANSIVADRSPDGVVSDDGAARTIQMFFGQVIKNEADPLDQVYKSYTIERILNSTSFQYLSGAAANEFKIAIPLSDKVTSELSYVAADSDIEGVQRSGDRLKLEADEAFGTATNVTRLRMINDDTGAALYTCVLDTSFTISNGVRPVKCIGTLGAFDHSVGNFSVSGEVEALFTDAVAVQAARNNVAVSIETALVVGNKGWLIDLPYLTMSGGLLTIEKDEPIKIPLSVNASAHPVFNHTLLVGYFNYLPDLAE